MGNICERLKPFALPIFVCLALVLCQVGCDFAAMETVSDISEVGAAQSGITKGLPEALSRQGRTLVECFMSDSDREFFGTLYNTLEPESSEAVRLAEKYPLAAKEAVCVLREDVTAENAVIGGEIYSKAAKAFAAYMENNNETGELQNISDFYTALHTEKQDPGEFGENIKNFGDSASLPDGALESMPSDALFTMPRSAADSDREDDDGLSNMRENEAENFGESHVVDEDGEGGGSEKKRETEKFSLPENAGTDNVNMEKIYSYLPLFSRVPQESIDAALNTAEKAGAEECAKTGIALKKLFYQEVGIDTAKMSTDYIGRGMLKMLGFAALGMLAAVLAGMIINRVAVLAESMRATVSFGVRAAFYGVVLFAAGVISAAKNGVYKSGGTFAGVIIAGAAVAAATVSLSRIQPFKKTAEDTVRLYKAAAFGASAKRYAFRAAVSLALPMVWLAVGLICSAMMMSGGGTSQAVFSVYIVGAAVTAAFGAVFLIAENGAEK